MGYFLQLNVAGHVLKKMFFDSGLILLIIAIIIATMYFACTMIVNIIDLAGWFSSPTAKALLFIIERVK